MSRSRLYLTPRRLMPLSFASLSAVIPGCSCSSCNKVCSVLSRRDAGDEGTGTDSGVFGAVSRFFGAIPEGSGAASDVFGAISGVSGAASTVWLVICTASFMPAGECSTTSGERASGARVFLPDGRAKLAMKSPATSRKVTSGAFARIRGTPRPQASTRWIRRSRSAISGLRRRDTPPRRSSSSVRFSYSSPGLRISTRSR